MFLSLGLFLVPSSLHAADLEITEIMYNPEGSDTDYEWIEVHNTTNTNIDLSEWAFYENETNHGLNDTGDGLELAADSYAVIARSPDSFSNRRTVDMLVESSFSLVNSGETIGLTTPEDEIVSEVLYEPADSADNNGDSLQLVDDEWVAADSTPGEENTTDSSSDSDEDDRDYRIDILEPREDPPAVAETIGVDAGDDKPAIVDLPVELSATITGISDHRKEDLDVSWALGNGDSREGEEISYTYQYPGEYVATLLVEDDEGDTYTDTAGVEVLEADFEVIEVAAGVDGYVAIENNTGRAVDVSGWQLRSGTGDVFTFPPHTIHLDDESVTITNEISGLDTGYVQLLLPNKMVVAASEDPSSSTNNTAAESSHVQTTYSSPTTQSVTSNANDTETSVNEDENDEASAVAGTSTAAGEDLALSTAFTATQTAAAAGSRQARSDAFWQWGGILILLLVITVGTAILLRRVSKSNLDPLVEASKFDINEID